MFLERTQLSRSSELREWAGVWKPSPRGGVVGATLGGGALADPLWSLVRQAQGPFSREGRRYRGAGGCWPWAGQVRAGFLGLRNPDCWGY